MTTSVDSNIIAGLLNPEDSLNSAARRGLDQALGMGNVILSAPVYAELLAAPWRNESIIEELIRQTGITVDWTIDESIWREAGRAFRKYATARRRQRQPGPRRILTDFIIGAHALLRKHRLLTLDQRIYREAFPALTVIGI